MSPSGGRRPQIGHSADAAPTSRGQALTIRDPVERRAGTVTKEDREMPVAVVMDFEGGTLAQYDAVIERMQFERGGAGAPGGLFHWVTEIDGGIQVNDVWRTQEQFEAFAAETMGPITQQVGVPAPARTTISEVYNYLTGGPEGEDLVRRFFEEFCNGRRDELAEELVSADFVSHGPQAPPAYGPDGLRARVKVYQDALDGHWTVEELVSTGDRVIARWTGSGTHRAELMGIDPTDKPISVEAISIFRIADGRIAEEWTVWDALGLLQQVGAVPAAA
jgi:steroid delta-isomerase-like uncharacterized protein